MSNISHLQDKRDELCQWMNQGLSEKNTERIFMISYEPAFREWMDILKTNLTEQYQVLLLETLFGQTTVQIESPPQPILKSSLQKIAFFLAGLIPTIGPFISGTQTVIDIAQTSYHYHLRNSDLQLLQDRLGLRPRRKNTPHRLKQIVFIPDYGALSDEEQRYLRFLAQLIQDGYLSNTALVIGQTFGHLCPIQTRTKKELLLQQEFLGECLKNGNTFEHISEILNIIGIGYLPQLKEVLSKGELNIDLMQALIDTLLDQTITEGSVSRNEFHRFLRLCSLLFEPFFQEDIEYNYPVKTLPTVELIEYALKSHLFLKKGYAPIYCFIEYFIRDFYRDHTVYTFPQEVYESLFDYLKDKYPYQYADIALLSIRVGQPQQQIEDCCIIAWYHEHDSLPQRKKEELQEILCSSTFGRSYFQLYEVYQDLDQHIYSECIAGCEQVLGQIIFGQSAPEARCCCLNLVATVAFESGAKLPFFLQILDCYFSAFQRAQIFTGDSTRYTEYITDALLLSAGLELPQRYRDTLERLAQKIKFNSKMPTLKRWRLFRLGNVLFPPDNGHIYTQRAYEESTDYPYEHILAAINYSASLLGKAHYSRAREVLDETAQISRRYRINSNTDFSFENNRIISQLLSGSISKTTARKRFEQIFSRLENTTFSDFIIVQNNYAASIVNSAAKSRCSQAEKILIQIAECTDTYHRFFALHNLLILYCLTEQKEKFLFRKSSLQIPYLLRWYDDFFIAKFDLIQEHFDNCRTLSQIQNIVSPLNERFPELNLTFYQLPILWGVIERWFE